MSTQLLTALSSRRIADLIRDVGYRVCYVAPGIQDEPAVALASLQGKLFPIDVTVSLDFDERTLRMGYGTLSAVETLRNAGIEPTHSPGFRSAVLIVDAAGWVFTPTALYLEAEPQSDETPNAIRLTTEQVKELLLRLCPAARAEAIAKAETPAEAARIEAIPLEISELPIFEVHFDEVKRAIKIAPPIKFDMARQVRVFEPYLQYVEIKLTGAAIQKHKVAIPKTLQQLGTSQELRDRLRTTFDLIEKGSTLSSKDIDDKVGELRKTFTPSLGERLGRVMLKNARPLFDQRLEELKSELVVFQAKVKKDLQAKLDESRDLVVEYFLPIALANPPDALVARVNPINEATVRRWLERELEKAFPTAEKLIEEMRLEAQFKDVTWETLNDNDFGTALRKAFEDVDWDKPFHDYKAAGESTKP
jgi:hypothetical protein